MGIKPVVPQGIILTISSIYYGEYERKYLLQCQELVLEIRMVK